MRDAASGRESHVRTDRTGNVVAGGATISPAAAMQPSDPRRKRG